ncbi:MAG: PBP1A family penicillin-binding protein [Deltaproteobacteria bacterium]|nr:PBP1A family penicillin-binding protein [Deltaproteobacteria bacterium]
MGAKSRGAAIRPAKQKSFHAPRRSIGMRIIAGILKWGVLLGLCVAVFGIAALGGAFWYYGSDPDLPRIHALTDYRPKQVTRVLAADGKLIGELFDERRTYVPLDRISPAMVAAIIDAEDADFRKHEGLDFMGMFRAVWINLRRGGARQGASTITQQVVKTFLLSPERTLKRKLQEIILARRLEKALSKDEILTLYLNQIYFGHGRYGVEEAARFFFGKDAAELNVGEAAVLAGLPQSPERLSPLKHPEAAKGRHVYVLDQMVKRGHLEEEEAKKWIDAPIALMRDPDSTLAHAPELVEIVRKELASRHGEDQVAFLGITVKTTLNPTMQAAAREALENGLRAIDSRHGYRGPLAKLPPERVASKKKELKKALPKGGPRPGDTYEALVVEVSNALEEMVVDLGDWKGAVVLRGDLDRRENPEGKKPSARFAKNDLVRVRLAPEAGPPKSKGIDRALTLAQGPQGAVVVIEPSTRHVLAMVGGYGYEQGQFNRALRAKRQPGSAFKPFVYAAALDSGQYTPASIVNDAPEVYDLWKPKNYDTTFRGPVRLREALAQSINTVAIRVLHDVGVDRVVQLAQAAGIGEELPKELSLALGSGVVTPLEITNAYATLASGGLHANPVFLISIGDEPQPRPQATQAIRQETAFLITSMMESVVESGTAQAAKRLKRRIAGKTGTSNGGRDAWFIGFTPDLVAGVWVGFDDMRRLGKGEAGGKAALPIWIELMKTALRGRPVHSFAQPPGIVVAHIDRKTGKLAAPGQPETETMEEVFLDGSVPAEVAPAPGEVDPSNFVLEQMEGGTTSDEDGEASADETPTP